MTQGAARDGTARRMAHASDDVPFAALVLVPPAVAVAVAVAEAERGGAGAGAAQRGVEAASS